MKDRFKNFVACLAFIALCVACSAATAQTPTTRVTPCNPATPNTAMCIRWGQVVERTDGLPVLLPITYRVERQLGAGTFATLNTTALLQFYDQGLAPGSYTYRVYAIEGGTMTSAPSNAAPAVVDAPPAPPRAPVIVIAVLISMDKAPVYRVVSGGIGSVVFGFVPTGRSCGDFVQRYRGLAWHKVAIRNPAAELWGITPAEAARAEFAAPCA